MDFAIHQHAGALYIYQIYDEFWCYSHDPNACVTAWTEIRKYANLIGISFNMKKTGSACVGSELDAALPRGPVGWGFLVFGPTKGRFVVDKDAVGIHVVK
jgi:hypothetical protein